MVEKLGFSRESCGGRLSRGCWDYRNVVDVVERGWAHSSHCDSCLLQAVLFLACTIWRELGRGEERELLVCTWHAFEALRTRWGMLEEMRAAPEKLGIGADGRTFHGLDLGAAVCAQDHCEDREAHRLELASALREELLKDDICALCSVDLLLIVGAAAGQRIGMELAESFVEEIETTMLELGSVVSVGN
jgi:hypothetical protein